MKLSIFTGNAHPTLARAICEAIDDETLGKAKVGTFSNGEIQVQIEQSVRGTDVYIIQPTVAWPGHSPNDALMELLLLANAAKGARAASVTAVIPCFGYARQDRRPAPRTPISARVVCNLLVAAGVDHVLTVDLHATQIEGFFEPATITNLYASKALMGTLKRDYMGATIVSPDAGGVARARAYAKIVKGELAIIDKRRDGPGENEVEHIIGNVVGKRCLVVDDLIDTSGTLVKGAKAVMTAGALSVDAMATHGVFSGKAAKNLSDSPLGTVHVTNTIPLSPEIIATGKVAPPVTIADLLADAISRTHRGDSLKRYTIRD